MDGEDFDKQLLQFCFENDETGNDEIENVNVLVIGKQPNTKPQQMTRMAESVNECIDGKNLNRHDLQLFWNKLTDELNNMGPPTRSSTEWRKVWSMHKSNKKRKHSTGEPSDGIRSNVQLASIQSVQSVDESSQAFSIRSEDHSNGQNEEVLSVDSQPFDVRSGSQSNVQHKNIQSAGQSAQTFGIRSRDRSNCLSKNIPSVDVVAENSEIFDTQSENRSNVQHECAIEKVLDQLSQLIQKQNEIIALLTKLFELQRDSVERR